MKNINSLQSNIKNEMLKSNLTIREVERRAGLGRSVLNNILRGKSKNPNLSTLQSIAEVLNCSLSDLIDSPESEGSQIVSPSPHKPNIVYPVITSLFEETTSVLTACFKNINFEPNLDQFLHCLRRVYTYALEGGENKVDVKFAEWLVDKFKE